MAFLASRLCAIEGKGHLRGHHMNPRTNRFKSLAWYISGGPLPIATTMFACSRTRYSRFRDTSLWRKQPDLLPVWDLLYERSVGCIGILKEWLDRALIAA